MQKTFTKKTENMGPYNHYVLAVGPGWSCRNFFIVSAEVVKYFK